MLVIEDEPHARVLVDVARAAWRPRCIMGFEDLQAFFQKPEAPLFLGSVVSPPILAEKLSAGAGELTRGSEEAIGLDIRADMTSSEAGFTIVEKGNVAKIPTGWALRAPPGHYLRVVPRSGLGLKGIDPLAGVVDRDYTGEIFVVLTNHSTTDLPIAHGDRIAQIIAERATIPQVQVVERLPGSACGGFGSTGK